MAVELTDGYKETGKRCPVCNKWEYCIGSKCALWEPSELSGIGRCSFKKV